MSETKSASPNLTEGPLLGKMLRFCLALIATGLLQTLYNASDMVVVGRFSSDHAMGAVGACGSLINLIINAFLGLSVGAGVCIAHEIGAQKHDEIKKTVNTSLLASIFCGIAVGIIGYFLADPLLTLMGTPQNVHSEAVPYMKAYFVGIPGCMVYNFMAAILRSSGDTKSPLIILTISGIGNIILNLIMVIVFDMGALGVGIATAASQYISAFLVVIHMIRMSGPCKIHISEMKIDKSKLWHITKIGIPAGFQGVLFSLSNVLIQSSVNAYGDIVVDGNSAASNIEGFVYISMNSMYHTVLTFVGQNVGAGKYERIKKIVFECVIIVSIIGLTMGISAYIFGDALLSIYAPSNADVRAAGLVRLSIISTTYFLCGLMDVGCGTLRGMGKSTLPMLISLIGSCVFRIVWIYTICELFPGNIRVLYYSYPVSWILTAGTHFLASRIVYKKMITQRSQQKSVL